jgi:hypothetical protein
VLGRLALVLCASACAPTPVEVLHTVCGAGPVFVRGNCSISNAPADRVTLQLDGGATGDLVVVSVAYAYVNEQLSGVSDTLGTNYQPLHAFTVFDTGSSVAMRSYYGVLTSSGAFTVTGLLDRPQVHEHIDMFVQEYSGVSALDSAGVLTDTTPRPTSKTLMTTSSNELLYGFASIHGFAAPGDHFTQRFTCLGDLTEDTVVPSAGPAALEFGLTSSASAWGTTVAAFKASACDP